MEKFRSAFSEFLNAEFSKTGRRVERRQQECGCRKRYESDSRFKRQSERVHERCKTMGERWNRTACFCKACRIIRGCQVCHGNEHDDCKETFNQHATVSDETSVLFVVQLFSRRTARHERMESGNRAAGNGDEKNRE